MRRFSLIFGFIVLWMPAAATAFAKKPAAPAAVRTAEDPLVTVTTPPGNKAAKYLLFPLRLPYYIVKGATWPLVGTVRLIEKHRVVQHTVNFLSNKEKTFWVYPLLQIGAGSGFGGGAGVRYVDILNTGFDFHGLYMIFIGLDMKAQFSVGKKELFTLWDRPVSLDTNGAWMRMTDYQFYGIGNDSQQGNRSYYKIQGYDVGGSLGYDFVSDLSFVLGAYFYTADTGTPRGGQLPTINTTFPASALPGFQEHVGYAEIRFGLSHDNRQNSDLSEHGGLHSFLISRFQGLNQSGFDYNEYHLTLRQYFRLGAPRYVLVLNNSWVFQQETANSQIPFYRLAVLDYTSPLRGFSRNRFQDRGSVVFNAEYRYPVWDIIDGMLFVDTGRVYPGWSDFTLSGFKYSVGGGIRFRTKNFMLFLVQAAYGGEGVNMVFSAMQQM